MMSRGLRNHLGRRNQWLMRWILMSTRIPRGALSGLKGTTIRTLGILESIIWLRRGNIFRRTIAKTSIIMSTISILILIPMWRRPSKARNMVRTGTDSITLISSLVSSIRTASTEAMAMFTITEEIKLKEKVMRMASNTTAAGPTTTTMATRLTNHLLTMTGGVASRRISSRVWSQSMVMTIAGRINSNRSTRTQKETVWMVGRGTRLLRR